MTTEKRYTKKTKAQQFVDAMIRLRSIEFAKIGMMIEVDGDLGTIVGMNSSANLDVQFANQLPYGKLDMEEPFEGCAICNGEGEYDQKHMIPWDKIKLIYSKAVEGLAIANRAKP